MHIREKMLLMFNNPVNAWHEHVWFQGGAANPVLNVALLEKHMAAYDAMGFDKLVMSLPVTNPKRCSVELFKAANTAVYESMKRYPGKIYGMAYVHAGHIKEALYEIDHCVQDLGMVGLKLYYDYFMDDPVQFALAEKCIDLDIPILIHSGHVTDPETTKMQPRISDGVHMANIARRYPEATFIMGHIGGGGDWQWAIKAIADCKNVYADIGGSIHDRPLIEESVRYLGADRLLFATDGAWSSGVSKILGADISDDDKKTILAGCKFSKYLERAGK